VKNLLITLKIYQRESAIENLTTGEINKLLFGTDNKGRTVWHMTAMQSNFETFKNYGSGLKII
jgi:hypothetical protein